MARTSNSLLQAAKQAATGRWWERGCSGFDLFTSLEIHTAVAFIHRIDHLVTWNFKQYRHPDYS
jgi:hypothetical protein